MEKIKNNPQELDVTQANEKLNELRSQLFTLRLNSLTSHVKDYSQFKKLRKAIARIMTFLSEKSNAASGQR